MATENPLDGSFEDEEEDANVSISSNFLKFKYYRNGSLMQFMLSFRALDGKLQYSPSLSQIAATLLESKAKKILTKII